MSGRAAATAAVVCVLVGYPANVRLHAEGAIGKPVTYTVTIDEARFAPADLAVKRGDSIVWVNRDILAHTATSQSGGFDSKVIQPGQSWKYTATRRGDFAYACSFHPMRAILKVE